MVQRLIVQIKKSYIHLKLKRLYMEKIKINLEEKYEKEIKIMNFNFPFLAGLYY